ncbi:hypothetical protein M6B38_384140 [Iris pallida]|uniref:Uncharacterized protein n=1 Tax=Iris pallida TaxID=29817 RepID=A0AAX6G3N7_IRIPA|nr:hypothetical protein M6B38_384140 [Iris pallida]
MANHSRSAMAGTSTASIIVGDGSDDVPSQRLHSSFPATLLLSIGELSVPAVQIWTISSRINDLFNRTIDF